MSIPDSEALLEEASATARDASNILKRFKDEPEGVYIDTLSGPLPSLKEWLKLRRDEFDIRYEEIQDIVDAYGDRFNVIHETDGTLKVEVVSEDNLDLPFQTKINQLTKIIASSGIDEGAGGISFSDTIAYVSGTIGAYMVATKQRIDNLSTLVDENDGNIQDSIDTISDQITGIDQAIDDLEAAVQGILTRLQTAETSIGTLQTFQTSATGRLNALESFRTTTESTLTTLGNNLTTLTNSYNASIASRTLQASSANRTFGSVAANSEANLTITVTGATVAGSNVIVNSDINTSGIMFDAYVSAANTVNVRCYNRTAAAITVSARTFYVTVIKHV